MLMEAVAGAMADLHTATIAKVTKVGEKTIECKPVINRVVNGESIPLPVFADVPPMFLGGGSSYVSMPIEVDDYCLLIFTERCFDRWWNGQDFQSPAELRMHDYSDGFAFCGIRNLAGLIAIPSDDIVLNGSMCLGSPTASDALALASKVEQDFQNVVNAISGAATVPADGGAAFKTNILAGLSSAGVPNNVGSSKIKAE